MAAGPEPEPEEGDFGAWMRRAERALADADCERVLAAADVALKLRPGDVAATTLRATALCSLDRLEEAVAEFSEVVEKEPSFFGGYFGRAGALLELARARGPEALGATGVDMALSDFDAALRMGDDVAGRELTLFLRGQFLLLIGRFSDAVEDLAAALETAPDSSAYLVHLGNARFGAGDPEGGLAAIQKIADMIEQNPTRRRRAIPRPPAPRRSRPSRA